jgi:Tfp pilus assembly protein PilX
VVNRLQNTLHDDRGTVLVVVVVTLVVLTLIGIAALRTSDTEMQVSANQKLIAAQFYAAEAGLVDTMEKWTAWMNNDFLTAPVEQAFVQRDIDIDGDDTIDSTVEIRCIQDVNAVVAAGNDLPVQTHTGPPPVGSGYSSKYFEVRRYGITATSTDGNTRLQIGVYKAVSKY